MNYQKEKLLLRVDNVSLTYDRPILRNINFDIFNITRPGVTQGQVISLIGRSGIGKTQLFRILSGLNKPTSGTVKIGDDMHQVRAGEIGVIPQNYILFNHRTIYENLKIGLNNASAKYSDEQKKELINSYANKF